MTTFDRIKQIIVERHFVDGDKVTEDANFDGDLLFDGLDWAEFLTAIEGKFEIEVSDDDFDDIQTVRDAVRCIDGKRKVAA